MTEHNKGDTVKVVCKNGKNVVGEYKGTESKNYGEAHIVKEFKTGRNWEFAVGSDNETVKEYSVI